MQFAPMTHAFDEERVTADGGDEAGRSTPAPPSLYIVDADQYAGKRLAADMHNRGFAIQWLRTAVEARRAIESDPPEFALVEVRLGRANGLDVLAHLREARPSARVVILTQYDSLTTATLAIRMGAVNYLTKWPHVETIVRSLRTDPVTQRMSVRLMSDKRIVWEHVQRVYELNGRNVTETARKLDMHRRTLQRMLTKRSPI